MGSGDGATCAVDDEDGDMSQPSRPLTEADVERLIRAHKPLGCLAWTAIYFLLFFIWANTHPRQADRFVSELLSPWVELGVIKPPLGYQTPPMGKVPPKPRVED